MEKGLFIFLIRVNFVLSCNYQEWIKLTEIGESMNIELRPFIWTTSFEFSDEKQIFRKADRAIRVSLKLDSSSETDNLIVCADNQDLQKIINASKKFPSWSAKKPWFILDHGKKLNLTFLSENVRIDQWVFVLKEDKVFEVYSIGTENIIREIGKYDSNDNSFLFSTNKSLLQLRSSNFHVSSAKVICMTLSSKLQSKVQE